MTTNPERRTTNPGRCRRTTTQEYLPFAGNQLKYGVVQSKEPTGNIYNAVYFNKEKFSQVDDEYLTPAYDLMDFKKWCYDCIQQNDALKTKAVEGLPISVPAWIDNDNEDEIDIFQEVLDECEDAGTLQGFDELISKYRAPNDSKFVTRDPSDLLKRRMAICVLKHKSLPEHNNIIFVASVHNYSGRSGKGSPENYASLLFDFLSKLPRNVTVIVAGDFNFDIRACEDQFLTQYFPSYHIPRYRLRPLREGLSTIDFIMVTKTKPNAQLQVSVTEVQAHDLQVDRDIDDKIKGDHRKITNHSPVSAVVELKLKKLRPIFLKR